MKKRNPVARHARKFNRAVVMTDRKRAAKAGHQKHKGARIVSFTCVNCGEQNWLGDCCPECAARDCDRCGIKIPMDEENTPNTVFPDWDQDEFSDGAYNVCDECLTNEETKLRAIFHGDGVIYVRKDGTIHFHADSTNTILMKNPKEKS